MNKKMRIDLSEDLLSQAALWLQTPNNAQTIGAAVKKHLPQVVEVLRTAGMTSHPTQRQVTRLVPEESWDAVSAAVEQIATDRVSLIRCCLVLASREPQTPPPDAGR